MVNCCKSFITGVLLVFIETFFGFGGCLPNKREKERVREKPCHINSSAERIKKTFLIKTKFQLITNSIRGWCECSIEINDDPLRKEICCVWFGLVWGTSGNGLRSAYGVWSWMGGLICCYSERFVEEAQGWWWWCLELCVIMKLRCQLFSWMSTVKVFQRFLGLHSYLGKRLLGL